MTCTMCGREYDLIRHHVSYEPEEVVTLCHSCHSKVHTSCDHDLLPDRVPPERRHNDMMVMIRSTAATKRALLEYMKKRNCKNMDDALIMLMRQADEEPQSLRADQNAAAAAEAMGDFNDKQ